jgi:hypothetical protein
MAVLSHPIAWRREAKRDVDPDLSPQERENVRKAVRYLARRFGSYGKLADAMCVKETRIKYSLSGAGTVSVSVALRAAKVAKVPLEAVLAGAWPKPTSCPHCGRE